jgi:dipeptidyl-peptidase-4
MNRIIILTSLLLAVTASEAYSQSLSVDRIFHEKDFSTQSFSVNWMPTGDSYFMKRSADPAAADQVEGTPADGDPAYSDPADGDAADGDAAKKDVKKSRKSRVDIVLVSPTTGEESILLSSEQLVPEGKSEPLSVASFQVSNDEQRILIFTNTRKVWRLNTRGDYWVADLKSGTLKKLGGDADEASLMFAKFSPDSESVAYVRDRNIYIESLSTNAIEQITETESDDIINGTSDWVYEEELYLRDGFQWSDDGKRIVFWRFDTSGVGQFTMINNTAELYPTLVEFQYPKVGTTNSDVSIGIYTIADQQTQYVAFAGDPRENYVAKINWIPESNSFLLQRLNRLQNKNTIYRVDAETAKATQLFQDTDDAWVEVCHQIQFWPDNQHFSFTSEVDGWHHIYKVSVDSGERELLTPGEFDVVELYHLDLDEEACYFQGALESPLTRYLYRQPFGGEPERITPDDQLGWHDYKLSADGSAAVHSYSQLNVPPTYELVGLPSHNVIESHADNSKVRERLAELPAVETEFFRVDVLDEQENGFVIDAMMMKPPGFDPSQQYPSIVYVYGEPWGTTVNDKWGGSTYLWHRMLCESGYVVLSFDNRGAKVPRGAGWRKAIYKQIGTVNAFDQANALRATLETFDWLDKSRVGIWGWSGGGSSTLNAMFKYPELYSVGVSVAPVPNQLYYDTIYQERYMQTPDLNAEGLHAGSPINSSQNLEGDLLLIHGTGDDNCHYQTMELLINKLIAENKQFDMMAYPNRSHSINEFKNTSRHLRTKMTEFFMQKL